MDSASPGEDGPRSAPRYRIVDHVLSLPGANLLRTAAVERYGALKKRSALAAGALGVVEKFAALAYAGLAKPAAEKFSRPLQVADDLSCKVLGNLENGCSVVSKRSLKVIGNAIVFGKLKYSEGQARAHAKIDACWKLSGSVLNAARHPVDTAVSFVRCVGNTASDQLAIAEWACDSYIRDMPQGCPPENDPRKCALPQFVHFLWKASVRVTGYVITERQRARDLIERILAVAKRVLQEPTGFLRNTGVCSQSQVY
ncbi:hypothetical protein HPB50_013354 [Hyalomma asiaticum]|uniref:Uncharacterized protein n=1 Tax=Hyalomma asiaticum TaxID=266040 RepID=A0ACB7T2L2_HYAAI|nr:hypothetical protein HPB50_013354 [Hyalomma asiaticum]